MKRFLAVFLTLCLVLTGLPMAFAADTPTVERIPITADQVSSPSGGKPELAVDGVVDREHYWECSYPGTLCIDLKGVYVLDHLIFKLVTSWPSRTQTMTIKGSVNGLEYTTILEDQKLEFVQNTNVVTLDLPENTSVQYLQIVVTHNTGGGAQIDEIEVYGYDDPTVDVTVNKLVLTEDMIYETACSGAFVPKNAIDGNQGTFWNGNGQTAVFTLDLQTCHLLNGFVFKTPNWSNSRTQVVNVLGSIDGETYTPILDGQQTYFFTQEKESTITVMLPKAISARYFRLAFVSNDGDPNAQIGEIELYGCEDPNPPKVAAKLALTADMAFVSGAPFGIPAYIVDGNQDGNHWDGNGSTAMFTLNLKDVYVVDRVVLMVKTNWGNRTQTAYVQGSVDGITYTNIFDEIQTFNFVQTEGNTVTVELPENTSLQFFRLAFQSTTDRGNNAQLSEVQVYGYEDENAGSALNEIPLNADMLTVSGAGYNTSAANMVDNIATTYWYGNTKTATLTADLGATYTVSHFAIRIPNNANWGSRTQTVVVKGSVNGEDYTTLVDQAVMEFKTSVGEAAVVFDTPQWIRYLKLEWISNIQEDGKQEAPQVGELDIYGDLAPEKTVTVNFTGKNDVAIGRKTASSADALVALLDTVKAPALGGYKFAGWNNSVDDLRAWYEGGFDTTLTVNAVYEVDRATTYAVSATNAETSATGDLTFDSRVTVTATGDATPTYWLLDGAKVGFGQKSYTFYVSGNNVIEPKFDAIDTIAEVTLQQAVASSNGETFNLSVIAQTSVVGKDVSEFGVIYAANPASLKDATKSIKVVSSKAVGQQYMTHLLNVQPGKYRYAVAYMVVGDEIIYSTKAVQFQTKNDGTAAIVYKEGWNA